MIAVTSDLIWGDGITQRENRAKKGDGGCGLRSQFCASSREFLNLPSPSSIKPSALGQFNEMAGSLF
jgi:hypothetical protein